jgi:hypothetical protein
MNLTVEREDVWATSIEDQPGGLAKKLHALADAGADLDFIIARRSTERPGTGVLFVTPLRGDREVRAATEAGFAVASRRHSLRVEGPNQPGAADKIAQTLSKAGINLRGLSAAVTGARFVIHLAFDSDEDRQLAIRALQPKP